MIVITYPERAVGSVGDFDSKQMIALLEKYLGGWKNKPYTAPVLGPMPAPAPFKIYLVDRPDSVQTNILAENSPFRETVPTTFRCA